MGLVSFFAGLIEFLFNKFTILLIFIALENTGGSSKIALKDILIRKSVGAKSKNYDVMDLTTGELYHFTEGTKLQDVKVFAGNGRTLCRVFSR